MNTMQLPYTSALVVMSGGQDSTTCLYAALQKYDRVGVVTFSYGQRHSREILCARVIARLAGVRDEDYELVQLPVGILQSTSPLIGEAELEQYKDADSLPGGIEKTFVPVRNQLFLTIAANRAFANGYGVLVTGVGMEDYGGYPDCRKSFTDAFEIATNQGMGSYTGEGPYTLRIETPLMYKSKADTVHLAMQIKDCWEALAFSHTAYDGKFPPLGQDHASLLRARGFEEAGIPDPLVVRAVLLKQMCYPQTANYKDMEGYEQRLLNYSKRMQIPLDILEVKS